MLPGALSTARTTPGAGRFSARFCLLTLALAFACLCARPALAADTLNWRTNQNRVSADIQAGNLLRVLSQIAAATGWQVYVEPDSSRVVSAKFAELPPGEALRLLLGDLNFALVPATNAHAKLFVFRSSVDRATQFIAPTKAGPASRPLKIIPNELVVRLKPGMKIEDLARQLGAKVVGRIDGLNAYRLQFEDQAAAATASTQLAANSDVASVENNYAADRPEPVQAIAGANVPPLSLQLDPPSANGRVTIGLVDTAVQPLGNGLDSFLLKQLSVAGDAQFDPNTPSHGTAMAETMLSTLQTLDHGHSSIQILPVDVYGPNATTTTFDIALGIQTAINKGANPINVSSGGTGDSPVLSDLVAQAKDKGIIIYAAKGNDGSTELIYPAAYPGVTPVTALDPNGQPTAYANKAPIAAIGAPGTSLVPYGNLIFVVQGTSPATAIASSTAASVAQGSGVSAQTANNQLWRAPTGPVVPNPGNASHK